MVCDAPERRGYFAVEELLCHQEFFHSLAVWSETTDHLSIDHYRSGRPAVPLVHEFIQSLRIGPDIL